MNPVWTKLALRDALLKTLVDASKLRHLRGSFNEAGELGWVIHERELMHQETNRYRAGRGLPPVDLAEVARVERQAEGHSDYASKFALYCAELAVGER